MKLSALSRLINFVALTLVVFISLFQPLPSRVMAQGIPPGDDAKVIRVVSADTIEVTIGNIGFTIGLLGVIAPKPPACFGKQGTAFVNRLLRGKRIRVVRDQSDFDAGGRLLRYVYLADGSLLNETVTKLGYARTLSTASDVQLLPRLQQAEQDAQANRSGLWKACPSLAPAAAPTTSVATTVNSQACPTFSIGDVVARGPLVEPLKALPDGSCVNLTGSGGSGKYVWHPAGSPIRNDRHLLIRWQDGEMSLSHQADGSWLASFTESQIVGTSGAHTIKKTAQTESNLIRMGDANQFLGIDRTYLLLDTGNNNLITLVDAFQWTLGDFYKPTTGRCDFNLATRQCPARAHWVIEN